MQNRMSSLSIHDSLIDAENRTKPAKPSAIWVHFQFTYTMINTLLNTYFDTTTEITESAEMEKTFLNTNVAIAVIALTLSLYLSACQGIAFKAQSEHFQRSTDEDNDAEELAPLTSSQVLKNKILAYSHYLAEISNGAQPLILTIQLANMPSAHPLLRVLPYLGVTLYSGLANIQELTNTLVAYRLHDGNISQAWKFIEMSLNLLNPFLKTTYTVGPLVTKTLHLSPTFLKIAWQGYVASLPLALFFATCESLAHLAESEHFLQANDASQDSSQDIERASIAPVPQTLGCKNEVIARGHYLSDVTEGFEPPLVVANAIGIQGLPIAASVPIYVAMGLYSLFGNVQEYKNTRIALAESQARGQNKP